MPTKAGCKEGWWPYAGYCYKLMGYAENIWNKNDFKQYSAANQTCESEWVGGMLAKLPSLEHNALVAALLGPSYAGEFPWIGVYSFALYDHYFTQIDQENLYFSNWETGMPNHLSGSTRRCVQMNWRSKQTYHDLVKLGISRLLNLKRVCFVNYYTNLGQWENVACTELRPFVCSHEQVNQYSSNHRYPTYNLLPGVVCAEGWIPYHSACYKLFLSPKRFTDAQKDCQDQLETMPTAKYRPGFKSFY